MDADRAHEGAEPQLAFPAQGMVSVLEGAPMRVGYADHGIRAPAAATAIGVAAAKPAYAGIRKTSLRRGRAGRSVWSHREERTTGRRS
jgi:hypothetical protein